MPRPVAGDFRRAPGRRCPKRRTGFRIRTRDRVLSPPFLLITLGLLLPLLGCSGRNASVQTASDPGAWITVLHTNDIHGAYAERPAEWLPEKPMIGGFRALAGTVTGIREQGPSILVDCGDLMAGTPLTSIEYRGVPGGGAMALMNSVGYDAMALGNHEFDLGRDALRGLIGLAAFPVLCANLDDATTGKPFAPAEEVILERGGLKIALVGLILDDLAAVVAAEPIRGLEVVPSIEAARAAVARLDPKSDVIIVLAHMGLDPSRAMAREVPGIDVILCGHDHRRTEEPIIESGTLVIETGSRLERLGRLDLRVAGDRVVDHRFELLDLPAAAGEQAPAAVRDLYAELDARIQSEYGTVVAELAEPFIRDSQRESNIGNWVTDAFRSASGADFAVTNSTGIRADVEAGPLTRFEIHSISPFPNTLCTFRASGEQLMAFARKNARKALGSVDGERAIVQVSGLSYRYGPDGEVVDLKVGGLPVDAGRIYVGATSDFVAVSQADKYLGFEPAGIQSTGRVIFDVLCEAAARTSPIAAEVEGRIAPLDAAVGAGTSAAGNKARN